MVWPGQTTPATPMKWPGAPVTTTAPLGGVPERVGGHATESVNGDGGGAWLWVLVGVAAVAGLMLWQLNQREQERGRADTRLRAEELRQDMAKSRVEHVESGPDWVRLRVSPGARISDEVRAGYAGGWAVLPSQVETVSTGVPDEYLLRVKHDDPGVSGA